MRPWLAVVLLACGPAAPPSGPANPHPGPSVSPVRIVAPAPAAPAAPRPTAESFLAECRGHVDTARAEHARLVAAPAASVEATLEPMNRVLGALNRAAGASRLAYEVHPEPAFRDAGRTCEREMSGFHSELFLDRRVYDAIREVDVSQQDAATQRFAAHLAREYVREGIALAAPRRAHLLELSEAITDVGQQIHAAIATDTREVAVTDPARLAGLPADWLAAHPADAGGVIRITTDAPDYHPVMAYAADDALRKELHVKFRSRGDRTNERAIARLLALRAEKAKLLGFATWADYISDDKMVRGGKAASQFIERVATLARPHAQREYAALLAQLRTHDPKARSVGLWQQPWLEAQIKKQQYEVDPAVVREYLPFSRVLEGLLALTGEIYELSYHPVEDPRAWAPGVRVYDVRRGTTTLGRVFLDLHPRADKYKHAAVFPMTPGVAGAQVPEAALVTNLSTGRLEHGDVVTLFHEFGHLMHAILGGHQRWVTQSGIATEHDFVEAPSMMFEDWAWRYETLARFAKHERTGAVIPRDLVEKLGRARRFGQGLWTVQQLYYAAISLAFHTRDPRLDQLALVRQLQTRYMPFAFVEGTRLHAGFGHLVDYSSMYYTYLWSLVIAKDLLTPFARSLLDPTLTRRYRDTILAPGGSKDAAQLVQDFLGRPHDFAAYERFLAGS